MKYILIAFFVFSYVFWLHFLIFTAYQAARDAGRPIPKVTLVMVAPAILIGALQDVIYNATLGSLLFLERPRTWTLTARCDSHLDDTAWRGALARWLCHYLLDPFQTGGHCHR